MLGTSTLKARLRAGEPVLGLINSIPSALMVEMVGYAGFDFVVLDMEHVSGNPETLEHAVRAAELAGVTPLVRVPAVCTASITRALDCGAYGILVPHVCSVEAARAVVQAGRYHPVGCRGISGGRTTGFGRLPLGEYFGHANDQILLAVMIEDRAGVEAVDEIAAVPGIDMLLDGAIDLSQSYGVPGDHRHPDVRAAIERIAAACALHGKWFCTVPRTPDQASGWAGQGVQAFLVGDDRAVAFRALKQHAMTHRAQLAKATACRPGAG